MIVKDVMKVIVANIVFCAVQVKHNPRIYYPKPRLLFALLWMMVGCVMAPFTQWTIQEVIVSAFKSDTSISVHLRDDASDKLTMKQRWFVVAELIW